MALLVASCVQAQTFAIRAGRVLPVAEGRPWVIEDGIVLVRDGKIAAVGPAVASGNLRAVEVPPGVQVVELPDSTVMPGLVAAASGLVPPHGADESVGADYLAADAFDRFGDYREAIAGGVTTAHVGPGSNRLVGGQGAVVKLAGPAHERVMLARADLSVSLTAGARNPPTISKPLVPPSPDRELIPDQVQRPASRMEHVLALREAIARASEGGEFDVHRLALAEAWEAGRPLRIHADEAADISAALAFLESTKRTGYIVGGRDAALAKGASAAMARTRTTLVYEVESVRRSPARDLGNDPDAREGDVSELAGLEGVRLALASESLVDLRLAAATALRAGLSEQRVIEAVTHVPAEAMGVADRVGSLAPGRDADILVLSGPPLETSSHVQRVYVNGRLVHRVDDGGTIARGDRPLVVRGGTVWLGPNEWLEDGSVLIEGGRIVAVGKRVPHPPNARVIHAGNGSFVVPGFIDAFGHLGFEGDGAALPPEYSIAPAIGVPDAASVRAARAGVTTVMASSVGVGNTGARVSAIKTGGVSRADRVVAETAGLVLDLSGSDFSAIGGALKSRIDAGKKYVEKWRKYEQDLAAWEKARAEGKSPAPAKTEEVREETRAEDPITGIWAGSVEGGPFGGTFEGRVSFQLRGSQVEGRVIEPPVDVPHRILGTLDGLVVRGTIEVEAEVPETPTWEATIEGESMKGTVRVGTLIQVNFSATRVEKKAAEFRVETRRRKTTGEDGRPLPPEVDESLEPMRAAIEGRIPLVIRVGTGPQIRAVLETLTGEYEVPFVLAGAEGARLHAEMIAERKAGVIVPPVVVREDRQEEYVQADDLSRRGIAVAMQSGVEDGTRSLPAMALLAVERGLSAEEALAALTVNAARLYRLEDRIGVIKAGAEGDLLIFSGHPLEAGSRIERVIVSGEEVR